MYFDGSAYMTFPAINFGNSDFTVDWWEYVTSSSSQVRFCSAFNNTNNCDGIMFGYDGTKVYATGTANSSSWTLVSDAVMLNNTLNTWVHWAIVRKGTTLSTYKNGTLYKSVTINGAISYTESYPAVIGAYRSLALKNFIGYIDEFRISNIARWTENFTPPTGEY